MNRKIVSIILVLIYLMASFAAVSADPNDMVFDGTNYLNTQEPVAFKGNFWHTGIQESDIIMPLRAAWELEVGNVTSQPIFDGKYLYILAGDSIKQIDSAEASVVGTVKIQTSLTPSNSHITLVKNGDGWFNSDKKNRLIFGTRQGKVYCLKIIDGAMDQSWVEWVYDTDSSLPINSNPAFVFDTITEDPYVVFGSDNKYFYILDNNGNLVHKALENAPITSAPIVFHTNYNDVHSSFLYGVDSANAYISSGMMNYGEYKVNPLLNKNITTAYQMDGIAGITTEAVEIDGISQNIAIVLDRKGNMFCISLRTGELLWKLSKYAVAGVTATSTPSIDEDYAYGIVNRNGKAKIFAVDYRRAIELGKDDPYSSAVNAAIVFDSEDDEFGGISSTSVSVIRVTMHDDEGNANIRGRIAIVGDSGSSDNLKVYYTNQADNSKAKRIRDAFQVREEDTNKLITKDAATIPGGVKSEILYSGGYVYVVGGNGKLYAFSGTSEDNLALLNMQNSQTPVQRGQSYEVTANIANYTGKDSSPLDIIFTLITESGEKHNIEKKDMVIPAAGLTTHLSYTVPADYSGEYISIRCEINAADAEGNRKSTEVDYEDNIQELRVKVAETIDLAASIVRQGSYKEKRNVTTNIQVTNYSNYDLQDVPIDIYMDGAKLAPPQVPKYVSIGKQSTITIPLLWYAEELKGSNEKSVVIAVHINPGTSKIQEINKMNNYRSAVTMITKDLPDFEVLPIPKLKYQEKTRVTTIIKVRNNSNKDFVEENKVELVFLLNGSSKTELIELRANSDVSIPFTWTAPAAGTNVVLKAEVNPKRKPTEISYSNNTKQAGVEIIKRASTIIIEEQPVDIIAPPPGCSNSRVEWSEVRFSHWQTVKVGEKVEEDPETGEPVVIPIYEERAVYTTKYFWAELTVSASLSETQLKSGYGFEAFVNTQVSSNYDQMNKLAGAQVVYAYFPENQYAVPLQLEPINSTTSLGNTWRFYVNYDSVTRKRQHYTPVWFPDRQNYTVQFVARFAQSPGGQMCETVLKSIFIDGNMYEDDTTGGYR